MATQDGPEGQQHGKTSLTLVGSEQPVVLDGRLDEESWGKANVVRTFAQRDPHEGMPATEKTEVRALYDEENLYFGVQCFDSYTEGILATELRRDNDFINDDSFAVILDTFHDHRNAFKTFLASSRHISRQNLGTVRQRFGKRVVGLTAIDSYIINWG